MVNTPFKYLTYTKLVYVKFSHFVALLLPTVTAVIFNRFRVDRMVFGNQKEWGILVEFVISYAVKYFINCTHLRLMLGIFRINLYLAQLVYILIESCLNGLMLNNCVYKIGLI